MKIINGLKITHSVLNMYFKLLQWLNNLEIREKLLIFIAIPIVSILFFAISGVSEKYQQYNNSINTQNFLSLAYSLDDLVYELQKERGISTNLINQDPFYLKKEIYSQRELTDKALHIFTQKIKSFNVRQLSSSAHNELIELNKLIVQLPAVRTSIDENKFENLLHDYNSLNSHAINFIQYFSQLTNDNQIAQLGDAYTNLLWMKERAGQERATLMRVSISGEMDSKYFRKIIAYIEAQDSFIKNFYIKAPDTYRSLLRQILSHPVNLEVDKFRDAALNKVERNEFLNELQALIGYGGLIHDFKNYVIRGEKSYLEDSQKIRLNVKNVIDRYRSSPGITQEDLSHLEIIDETLDHYFDLINETSSYLQEGYSINQIDKLVRVDDSLALNAITYLRKGWSDFDTSLWWKNSTERIDLIKQVNNQVKEEILKLADENAQSAVHLLAVYFIIALATLLFSFVFGSFLMKRLIGELKNISENMKTMFQEKNFDHQLIVTGTDEIGVMAYTFNRLISERTKFESALHLSSAVYENAKEAIMIAGANMQIQMVNPAFTNVSGYSQANILGKDLLYLSCNLKSEHTSNLILNTLQQNFFWEGEVWNKKPSGEYYLIWLNINVVQDKSGTIQQYIAMFTDITERKQYENDIWRQANYDALTDLPNRKMCIDQLSYDLKTAKRTNSSVAVLFIDLDRFKLINDTLGHSAGDSLLIEIASRLKETVRESDVVSRLGGDEFVVILNDIKNISDIEVVSKKILSNISTPVNLNSTTETFTTTSIGIALYPHDGNDVETLMKHADTAMYQSKKLGRNNFMFYQQEMNHAVMEHMTIEQELRKALSNEQFQLYYQPIIDLETGRIIGAEALIRWQHPTMGLVSPDKFINIAEDTGLIVPIGEWIVMTAANQASKWNKNSRQLIKVAVNISSRQCIDKEHSIVSLLKKALTQAKLEPGVFQIEITESLLMDGASETVNTLNQIRDLGLGISLDDFGTGYSSLSYLKHFPISTLKIDKTFVNDATTNKKDAQLVKAIVMMSAGLDLDVVGEGIENAEQLSFLKNLGCKAGQGYYFSRPLTAEDFSNYLLEQDIITLYRPEEQLLAYQTQSTA